jgi:hypothetical protein
MPLRRHHSWRIIPYRRLQRHHHSWRIIPYRVLAHWAEKILRNFFFQNFRFFPTAAFVILTLRHIYLTTVFPIYPCMGF